MSWEQIKYWTKKYLTKDLLHGDFLTTGKYNFPQLAQVNFIPELPVLPFNYLKSTVDEGRYWYHCFTSEKNFNRLYVNFKEYEEILKRTKGIISADFNLYRNYPEHMLIDNCRYNRSVDYVLQQAGIPMIPTAGFAGESSWEWCFDGLPKSSTVAVTTNTLYDKEAHRLFVGGINVMVKKIQPTAIVVCGKCPDWMEKRFPEIQIVKIPNYSQMWHAREKI